MEIGRGPAVGGHGGEVWRDLGLGREGGLEVGRGLAPRGEEGAEVREGLALGGDGGLQVWRGLAPRGEGGAEVKEGLAVGIAGGMDLSGCLACLGGWSGGLIRDRLCLLTGGGNTYFLAALPASPGAGFDL